MRSHRNIKSAERSLDLIEFFFQAREFILMITFMNLRNVGKLLLCVDKLLNIREFILVRYLINIRNVGEIFRLNSVLIIY